jgi:hypothetical protein
MSSSSVFLLVEGRGMRARTTRSKNATARQAARRRRKADDARTDYAAHETFFIDVAL